MNTQPPFDEYNAFSFADDALDSNEAFQSYMIGLNPADSVTGVPLSSDSYDLSFTTPSYFPPLPPQDAIHSSRNRKVVQEKNKLAQRRFRDRQKSKISELQEQIQHLEAQINQLEHQNGTLQSHNGLLEKVLAMRDEHIKQIQNQTQKQGSNVEAMTSKDNRKVLERVNFEVLTPEGIMQLWESYSTRLSASLVEANSPLATEESTKNLEKLVNEMNGIFMRLSMENPVLLRIWNTREYHMSEMEELEKWRSLLVTLNLTEDQKTELSQLRRLLLQQLQTLIEDRKNLKSSIQSFLVTQTLSSKLSTEYLKLQEIEVKLRKNLRIEDRSMFEFCTMIIRKILNPVQVATLYVHGYPSRPDLLAFTSAVAKDLGEEVTVIISENENTDCHSFTEDLTPCCPVDPEKTESS